MALTMFIIDSDTPFALESYSSSKM